MRDEASRATAPRREVVAVVRGRRRHRALGILAGVATAAVIAAPVASAATAPPTPPVTAAPAPTHPEEDRMGSTIRAHEATPFAAATPKAAANQTPAMDVSGYQRTVDWPTAYARGARGAYVKATESTTYQNPYFAQQYNGSAAAGMVRGAYHFALPNLSSGATQANYFVSHGGGWSADGRTLPPMLDIEYNPYGSNICYGLSPAAMSSWIADFSNTVHARTGRFPTIYSTTNWWNTCTGSNRGFGANPLFVARYNSTVGALPASWSTWTLWQYSDSGVFPGDQDVFNGSLTQLRTFAAGGPVAAPAPAPNPAPAPTGPIATYYNGLGGARSYLGAPTGAQYAVGGGVAQNFAGGTVYYSAATGAHAVHGTILARYNALGGPAARLGLPTGDEVVANDGRGRTQTFANAASMVWNPTANAAFAVVGPAREKYGALGGPAGFLGYPLVDTTNCPDGAGTYTHFTGGSIYATAVTGAHEVHGTIYARWAQLGWERSALGYPTGDEQAVPGGRRSTFQRGSITWTAATGATTVTPA